MYYLLTLLDHFEIMLFLNLLTSTMSLETCVGLWTIILFNWIYTCTVDPDGKDWMYEANIMSDILNI